MNTGAETLAVKIASKKRREREIAATISKLTNELTVVRAEIVAYEDAARIFGAQEGHVRTPPENPLRTDRVATHRRPRSGGIPWAKVFVALWGKHLGGDIDYEIILDEIRVQGKEATRAGARTQAMLLVGRGYLERVRDGVFRITEKGRDYFSVASNEKEGDLLTTSHPSETVSEGDSSTD